MHELPPEAYVNEPGRYRLEFPLRGFFGPPTSDAGEGRLLRVNGFHDLERSIASGCSGLPGTAPGRPFILSPQRPTDGTWIASILELTEAPDPALVGLAALTPTWWQGTVGAARAEAALRAGGELLGFVVQDKVATDGETEIGVQETRR